MLKKKYNIDAIFFHDDTFVIDEKWVIELCDMLTLENVDIIWGCNSRVNLVKVNLFQKMYNAGLRLVCI